MELRDLIDVDAAVRYVRSCQTEDGGYFFARVPPSSGADTWYALASLRYLDHAPSRSRATLHWLMSIRPTANPHDVYLRLRILRELNQPATPLMETAHALAALQRTDGGFGSTGPTYLEVDSELQTTYEAVFVLNSLGVAFDEERAATFVVRRYDAERDFGARLPSRAPTFYAYRTLALLGWPLPLEADQAAQHTTHDLPSFLDHLYWEVMCTRIAGRRTPSLSRVIDFVRGCQRPTGGFARSVLMGIPTLQWTFQALRVLRACIGNDGCNGTTP